MWPDLVSVRRGDVVVLCSEVRRGHNEVHVEVRVVILKPTEEKQLNYHLVFKGAGCWNTITQPCVQ